MLRMGNLQLHGGSTVLHSPVFPAGRYMTDVYSAVGSCRPVLRSFERPGPPTPNTHSATLLAAIAATSSVPRRQTRLASTFLNVVSCLHTHRRTSVG